MMDPGSALLISIMINTNWLSPLEIRSIFPNNYDSQTL